MSIYTRGEPTSTHQFRANTEKNAGKLVGIRTIPSRVKCYCCEKLRTESTGRHTDFGFVCGMCGRK